MLAADSRPEDVCVIAALRAGRDVTTPQAVQGGGCRVVLALLRSKSSGRVFENEQIGHIQVLGLPPSPGGGLEILDIGEELRGVPDAPLCGNESNKVGVWRLPEYGR